MMCLVRSPQNIRCPLQERADVTVNVYTCVETSNIARVCVQNVLHVLEYKLEDADATA